MMSAVDSEEVLHRMDTSGRIAPRIPIFGAQRKVSMPVGSVIWSLLKLLLPT